ncbi:MAG TPA: cyclic-di-AMP receptor [Anaerolineales bacterium]|nr:cyclic-di-AMP receptor [Anaerolineales bacterium]
MKMILAIIRDSDNEAVTQSLVEASYRVTRIASTGGFLRRGYSTLLIGVEDEKVDAAIELIRDNTTSADEPGMKRATMFVLNVARYSQV